MKKTSVLIVTALLMLMCTSGVFASSSKGIPGSGKNAILLASFGTTVPEAVQSITNIQDAVKNAYPETEVRITFTSNIIRSVWKKRQADSQEWLDQGIPNEILYAKNFIASVGDLLEDGYTNIVVQPTHMFYMEQAQDLANYIKGLSAIQTTKAKWNPIHTLVMGRPALGMPGDLYSYHDDVKKACETLAADAAQAKKDGAVLMYMGHGNEHWSTGIYAETEKAMREMYPDIKTYIGVVEGSPSIDDIMPRLKHAGSDKILLKPFMIVAGNHATNDMAGPEEDSWKSLLTKDGYKVDAVLEGLGSNDAFAAIFLKHIADAAKEAGLELK